MSIKQISQISNRDSQLWFTDINIEVDATDKMQLNIGGRALIPQNGQQHVYNLSTELSFTAPQEGMFNHVIFITWDGQVVVDPTQEPINLAGQVCWFNVPAGTSDLALIEISQLIHVASLD